MQYEKQKKMKKIEQSLWEMWDTIKNINICVIGHENKRKEKRAEILFKEIMAKILPNLMKNKFIHQKSHQL